MQTSIVASTQTRRREEGREETSMSKFPEEKIYFGGTRPSVNHTNPYKKKRGGEAARK